MRRNNARNSFRKLVGKAEIADMLKISCRQVDYLRQKKGLPWFEVGSRVRFSIEKVTKWLENNERNGGQNG